MIEKNRIKIVLSFIGISFLLSILIGFIVGNPFLIVLERAILGSILFGALIYAAIWLINRYVPELLERKSVLASKPGDEETAGRKSEESSSAEGGDRAGVNVLVGKKDESIFQTSSATEEEVNDTGKYPIEGEGKEKVSLSGENGRKKMENELPPLEELLEEEEDVFPEEIIEAEERGGSEKVMNDYITVGSFKLPNEPEKLAKAIKKVLKQDES